MKPTRLLFAFVVLVCYSRFASAATDTPESVDRAWKAAVLAGDIEAISALYSSDAVAWFPDEAPAKGREAIQQSYTRLFSENTIAAVEITNNHVERCGDKAVGWGEFTMTLKPKSGGNASVMSGRFTELLKKEGSNWVYAVDHASANPTGESPRP